MLRAAGIESVLVEGGAEVITALLAAGLVDGIIVGIAPIVIGSRHRGGRRPRHHADQRRRSDSSNRMIVPVGDDIVLAWDVVPVV